MIVWTLENRLSLFTPVLAKLGPEKSYKIELENGAGF